MANINKNIIMQAGAAVANATNKAAGLTAATPEPGAIISAIQLVNGGRTIGPDALAHFTESVRNKLLSLLVSMEPIQSGSGTPTPDNIRPISGRTGLSVYVGPTTAQADATTYAVDWTDEAGTVYGGTLDVVTGVLTVDRAMITFDGSQSISASSNNRFYCTIAGAKTINASNQSTDVSVICDKAKPLSWASSSYDSDVGTDFCCAPVYGNGIAFRWDSITTAADWKTYFTNNPTQFSYELATPLTYQLTGQDIITLVGNNFIWSDSGDVTITE